VFLGLVWGGLAATLLYFCAFNVGWATENAHDAGIGTLFPNTTSAEQQELLQLWRSDRACFAVADLATAVEIAVNARFSFHFFEQQVWAVTHSFEHI
jgi:hypothetical protein